MKKKVLFLLTLVLMVMAFVISVSAEEQVGSFSAGSGVNATVYRAYEGGYSLVLSGGGRLNSNSLNNGIRQYKSELASVVIEDGVYGDIPQNAFSDARALRSVIIGEGIEKIGNYAFNNCSALESVSIYSEKLVEIGSYAFNNTAIFEIILPNSVISIGANAFANCQRLNKAHLGENVNVINAYAFSRCINLTEITIPKSVVSILDRAFSDCTSLSSVLIPQSVEKMGSDVFFNCRNLQIFVEANEAGANWSTKWSNTIDPSNIFYGTGHEHTFEEVGMLPATCTKEGEIYYACTECGEEYTEYTKKSSHNYKKEVTTEPTHFNKGVTTYTCVDCGYSYTRDIAIIPHEYDSEVLKEADHYSTGKIKYTCACGYSYYEYPSVIPHSYDVERVEATHLTEGLATYTCSCGYSYQEILPKLTQHEYRCEVIVQVTHYNSGSVKYICPCGHSRIETVEKIPHEYYDGLCYCGAVQGESPEELWNISSTVYDDVAAFLYQDMENPGLYRIEITGKGKIWWNKIPWSRYRNSITEIVIDVECDSFEIPPRIFENFTELRTVKIEDGLTRIGNHAFRNCQKLENLILPDTVDTIGAYAFERCTGLLEITGLDNVKIIGQGAFLDCRCLKRITIGRMIYQLEPRVFENCTSLESVVILGPIREICDRTFRYCTNLSVLVIDNTVYYDEGMSEKIPLERIGVYAFERCYNLKHCVITGGTRLVDAFAFAECQNLLGIDLGNELESIGDRAFSNCRAMKEIILPNSLNLVKSGAFYGCNQLTVYTNEQHVFEIVASSGFNMGKIITDCRHTHGNGECVCDHKHSEMWGEFEISYADHYSFGVKIFVCGCGASSVGVTDKVTAHDHNRFEKINRKEHIGYCLCGDSEVLEHVFEDSVCVDCGYKLRNVLDREDIIHFGFSIFDDGTEFPEDAFEGLADDFIIDGKISREDGALNLCLFNKLTTMFAFNVSVADINGIILHTNALFSDVSYYYVENDEGSIVLQICLKVDSFNDHELAPYSIPITGTESFSYIQIQFDNTELHNRYYEILLSEIQFSLGIRDLIVEKDDENGEIIVSPDDMAGEDENSVTINLCPKDVEWIKQNSDGGKLRIETKFGDVVFGRQAILKICEASKGITVHIEKSVDIRGKIKYSILVSDQDGNPLLPPEESDENGDITVHVKYKTGKKNINLKVEFHGTNEDGSTYIEEKTVNTYNSRNGMISFTTQHFSEYIIYDPDEDLSGVAEGLFIYKGTSKSAFSDRICIGYDINDEVLDFYKEEMGANADFGVVFASAELLGGMAPLDKDGNATKLETGMVAKMNLNGYKYKSYELVLGDMTEDFYDHSFIIAAYALTESGVVYFQDGGRSAEARGVTYRELYLDSEEDTKGDM